jgi:membrane fusion protein (multidrug efflux system)
VITTLDDDSVMKLDFSIPAVHLATLQIGLPIEARSPAFAGRTFSGSVTGIDSRIDPATRSVTVRAVVPNPERLLKPGLLMRVDLLKNEREVLVVPEEALTPSGREMHVMVVDRSQSPAVADRRNIAVGARKPGKVEVLDGLAPGELVVVHGALKVRPGQPVRVMAEQVGNEPLVQLLNQEPGGQGP